MRKVVLVPGIRTKSPSDTFQDLVPFLDAANVPWEYADYGYIFLPINNRRAIRAIKKVAEPGCVLVGFSNGGKAALKAAKAVGAKALVLISPAARCDEEIAACVDRVILLYSPGDWVNGLGGLYGGAVSLMPWRWGTPHGFGRLGVDGPCLDDERYIIYTLPDKVAHKWYDFPKTVQRVAQEVVAASGL